MNYKSLFLSFQLGRQDEFTTEIIQVVGHGFKTSFGLSLMICVKFKYLSTGEAVLLLEMGNRKTKNKLVRKNSLFRWPTYFTTTFLRYALLNSKLR